MKRRTDFSHQQNNQLTVFISLLFFIQCITCGLFAFDLPSLPSSTFQVAYGSEFTVDVSDIDGVTEFGDKPSFFLTTLGKRKSKTKLNVISSDNDSAMCQLTKEIPAGLYQLYYFEKGITTEPVLVTSKFNIKQAVIKGMTEEIRKLRKTDPVLADEQEEKLKQIIPIINKH